MVGPRIMDHTKVNLREEVFSPYNQAIIVQAAVMERLEGLTLEDGWS